MISVRDGFVPDRVADWLKREGGFSVEQLGKKWVVKQTYPDGWTTWVIPGEMPLGRALEVLAGQE